MFASLLRLSVAAILLIAYVSAFAPISTHHHQRSSTALNIIPITNGPTLNSEQAKAAGIGGLGGTKNLKSGGMGAFKVAPKGSKEAAKKKTVAAKKPVAAKKSPFSFGAKKAPVKEPVETKKAPVGLFTKMPWQK
ncbi:hypothetical protein QTG54_013602 [Skeletonema marinoi]|uniref:Uncharacterized protein n=1 Tax=Skeletonema marinoi TaxID=267567 RepID=A0A7S2PP70_9STRA|nr:hypothetical protein QTG54_013602 [Skeletonema marinoi]|mmetsp:Transcript_27350/g.46267  ORF Transcript_27350/g.46267 Transcript_27350/m.46267 type:complete len:135 (+) Transcript_27350:126-530(+)